MRNNTRRYDKDYFEKIYAPLKKEKSVVLKSFFELLLRNQKKIKNLLDLGCGEGEFLAICQEAGVDCFGIDISSYALVRAKNQVKGKFFRIDLEKEKLPFPDNFFDVVTTFDLVEHLREPKLMLGEIYRVLKEDGVLFLTTPHGGYWLAGFLGHFVTDDPTHVNIQGEKYWCVSLGKAGFSKLNIMGCLIFGFPPSIGLRYLFKKLKLPVITRPIFFPLLGLTSEVFIFARKS